MSGFVECATQAELDAAVAAGNVAVVRQGFFVARESSHVVARGSSHVVAWESSHVVAWGSSHVVARESSHVEARESSHVEAWGSSHVEASKFVAVHLHSRKAQVKGGVIIKVPIPATAQEWCEWYGIETFPNGVVTLYKAVDENYVSSRGMSYAPGTCPEAPDWDGGKAECGGGLHFSPHPAMALEFMPDAARFVACPVPLGEIVVHQNAQYPQKVKARRVTGEGCYEVDRYGEPLVAVEVAS